MHRQSNAGFAKLIGGSLCLDFVNTVGGRIENPQRRGKRNFADVVLRDGLTGYADLVTWAAYAGALNGSEAKALTRYARAHPVVAAAVFQASLKLRESIYRVFKAVVEQWPLEPDDLHALNRGVRVARAHETLAHAGSTFHWEWEQGQDALDRPIWPIVRSAAELLTAPELTRLGQCGGEECGWLFLDTSRSGRRKWCDMGDCGNLAKVRRFREMLPGG